MTPIEIKAALAELRAAHPGCGPAYAMINSYGADACSMSLQMASGDYDSDIRAVAATWEEALGNLRAKLAASAEQRRTERLRKLALAVIDLTQEKGEAADIDLRQRGFTDAELRELQEGACTLAAEMAAGAPFSVTFTSGSNGAPASEEVA